MSEIDSLFEEGCRLFNERDYFEAHEVWEDVWNQVSGPRHAFVQCLIQVAVALHHATNQNWKGARKLCASALGYLEKGKSECRQIDADQIREKILEIEIAIQEILAGKTTEIPHFQLPIKG